MGILEKLSKSLSKTRKQISGRINDILKTFVSIDDALYEELETVLITADLGVAVTEKIISNLRHEAKLKKIKSPDEIIVLLKAKLDDMLNIEADNSMFERSGKRKVVLIVGVNGVGKTTSIGKIAYMYKQKGFMPVIAAADTFRAAAADQLQIWADRADVRIIRQSEGADPSAVIYDAIMYLKSHENDVLLCDTAGRLHNRKNLMSELGKIRSIIDKNAHGMEIFTLLVIDAATGQNAVSQAEIFKEAVKADGIILTKIDGTAKGGVIFPVIHETGIPVKLIGVGEKIDDLEEFDHKLFIEALFSMETDI